MIQRPSGQQLPRTASGMLHYWLCLILSTKLDQLAKRLPSQGNNSKNKYWIGLVYKGSTGQLFWSSGVVADKVLITNSSCRKQQTALKPNDLCYLVKKGHSICFEKQECNKNHRHGYICQPVTNRGNYLMIITTAF